MKLIIATIKPFKLDEVRETMSKIGVNGMMVSEVKGFGTQLGHTETYRGAEYTVNYVPKIKLEIAVTDAIAEQVVEEILLTARTGKIGDGKIFIVDLEKAVRVRTGELVARFGGEFENGLRRRALGRRATRVVLLLGIFTQHPVCCQLWCDAGQARADGVGCVRRSSQIWTGHRLRTSISSATSSARASPQVEKSVAIAIGPTSGGALVPQPSTSSFD